MALTKIEKQKRLEKITRNEEEQTNILNDIKLSQDIINSLKVFTKKGQLQTILEEALNNYGIVELASEYTKLNSKKEIN